MPPAMPSSSMARSVSGDCQAGEVDGNHAAQHGADGELALGADVPDIGPIADRETDADQHQRRRLDDELLDRPDARSAARRNRHRGA